MKDVNQKTGKLIEKKVVQQEAVEEFTKPVQVGKNNFGAITGINLRTEEEEKKKGKKKRDNSPEMWERDRLKYWSKIGITDNKVNVEDSLSDEEEYNVELAE